MVTRITFLTLVLLLAQESHAQFRKNKKNDPVQTNGQQPTSLSPSSPAQKEHVPKTSRKSSKGPTYGLEQAYYERVEAVAKERRKAEKELAKPQYSDPAYFGHKRPPKKRKASKMKYCKECGIRH